MPRTVQKVLVESLADGLETAQMDVIPIPPLRIELGEDNVDGAYAVQTLVIDRRIARGRRLVGRKIGLTSKAVQEQLGVDKPDFGALLDDMAIADAEEIPFSRVIQPKVEAEVAFVMSCDVTMPNPTAADIMRMTDFVCPAIEVVDSRIEQWNIGIVDTVADNASSAFFVLGNVKRRLESLEDLRGMTMEMRCGGDIVSQGNGAACLGHPVNAVLWLARELSARGAPLREGDIVLSGALGPMVPAQPGKTYEATIGGLGSVRAVFSRL